MLLLVSQPLVAFFMTTTQQFETVVTLNTQQAKNELAALQKTVEDLKKKKAEALRDNGSTVKDINRINKEIKSAEANVKAYRSNVSETIETLNNLGSASVGDIERVTRALKREMKSVASPEEYVRLEKHLADCTARLNELKRSNHATLDQYNRAIAEAEQRTKRWDDENKLINATLNNISGSSLRKLETSLKLVNEQLQDADRGSDAYKKLTKDAKKLKTQIEAINKEQSASKSLFRRSVDVFNVNWGVISQAIAAVTGLSYTVRQCSANYALMDE